MLRFWRWSFLSCGLLTSVLVLSLMATENDKDKKPADKPDAKADENSVDLDTVPGGSKEELMIYIQKVMSVEPKSIDDVEKRRTAIGNAVDKIMDANPFDKELCTIFESRMKFGMSAQEATAYADKFSKIAAEFSKSGKAELSRKAICMTHRLKLRAADYESNVFKNAYEDSLKFLSEGKLQEDDMMLVMNLAQTAHHIKDQRFYDETLEKIIVLLKGSKLDNAEKNVKLLEGVLRRMKLVGDRIELEGNLLSGDKLDLAKYNGKVYLVDFWATWCGPCIGEIPNMKKNYEAYHKKGFEIIGLSFDQNQEVVEKFVKEKEIPWGNVYGDNKPSPSFEYYGITGIPTMILVGKDGKVLSTRARGEELDKLLEAQFGPAEKIQEQKDKS